MLKELKFKEAIYPSSKKIVYRVEIKKILSRGLKVALADGYVELDGDVIYEAKDLKIGLFDCND